MGKGQNQAKPSQQNSVDEPQEAESLAVVPEVVEELTEAEISDRHRLELKVERGLEQVDQTFYGMGVALRELRERLLYRSTHKNFNDYCQDRFNQMTRRRADYLIVAVSVVDDLKSENNCSHFLPTSESQVRSLKNLTPSQRREVWQQGINESHGKIPTAKTIKSIVERLKEKLLPQLAITYKRGDAFTLQGLTGAERRYNKCWAIAREVLEFSLKVETYDAMLLVKAENLDSIDEREVRRQLSALLKRIQRLRKCELDRGALAVLESLGKQTYLTEVEHP